MATIFSTWAALEAAAGAAANDAAYVYGPDAGTHTDPVLGGTVANTGIYAWSVSPAGWLRVGDMNTSVTTSAQTFAAVDDGTTSQTQLIWSPPPSALNSEGGYDDVDLTLQTGTYYVGNFGDGTSGTNYVLGLGWNLDSSFAAAKAGLPAVSHRIENKYRYNRFGAYVTQCEIHVGALMPEDDHAIEFRPITIGAPHKKADWADLSSMVFTNAYIAFLDGTTSTTQYLTIDARASNGGTRYVNADNVVFRESVNNVANHRQLNAAGTAYVNLPYVNFADHLKIETPIDVQATASVSAGGAVCVIGFSCNIPGGGNVIAHTDFTTTGSVTTIFTRGSASTYLEDYRENEHASGASGFTLAGKGPIYLGFVDTGNTKQYGMRYLSATQTLSIGGQLRGAASGVGDFVSFDCTTGQASFAYPAKIDPVPVASLPGAAAAGAGSRAFVSDANATSFASVVAGSGSNVVPVYSDGTDWRIG